MQLLLYYIVEKSIFNTKEKRKKFTLPVMILSPGHIDPLNYTTEVYLIIYLLSILDLFG